MPTYEYECERCGRTFEVEQKISDHPLSTCPLSTARTTDERFVSFKEAGGAISWEGRPFSLHPDRCVCQGEDPTPHRHYPQLKNRKCARCECEAYRPAVDQTCGGAMKRLVAGQTGFVLKGSGWFKDGY